MALNEALLADEIANNVLRIMGDHMKMTPAMAEWCENQSNGREVYFSYPVGFGSMPMMCEMVIKPGSLIMYFRDPVGAPLQRFEFHA